MTTTDTPSKRFLAGMPIGAIQAFHMIREKEDWTADEEDALSRLFEKLMSMDNAQEIIRKSFSDFDTEGLTTIIQMLAYLRIEQAIYFLTEMPIENKWAFVQAISTGGRETEPERINMRSRLETLAKMGMLDRIFSPERLSLVASVLSNYEA
jgi:hypothetical protein